jgi:hypothetical protein
MRNDMAFLIILWKSLLTVFGETGRKRWLAGVMDQGRWESFVDQMNTKVTRLDLLPFSDLYLSRIRGGYDAEITF